MVTATATKPSIKHQRLIAISAFIPKPRAKRIAPSQPKDGASSSGLIVDTPATDVRTEALVDSILASARRMKAIPQFGQDLGGPAAAPPLFI